MQFVFAGNDVEGLRYGVIDTPEKYWLEWKEPSDVADPLDRALLQLCSKDRFLELIHDFIVFDAGVKKARATTSTSASRQRRSASPSARAASSGTPRARARA